MYLYVGATRSNEWVSELKNKSDGEQSYGLVAFVLKVKATALKDESLHFSVLCRLHSHIIVEVLFCFFKQNSTTLAKFRLCLNDVYI